MRPRMTMRWWGSSASLTLMMALLGCGGSPTPQPSKSQPSKSVGALGDGTSPSSSSLASAPARAGERFAVPPGFPDTEEHQLAPDRAPTPYTAAEIRANCRKGRINKWRMVTDQGEFVSVQRFVAVDEKGARIQSLTLNANGSPTGKSKNTSGTWIEFQGHASYPAAMTEIRSEWTQVPMGEFECWVYIVEEKGTTTTYWFAKTMPGPPVRIDITKGKKRLLEMEQIELVTGK